MRLIDLPIHQLVEAYWNPNQMDEATLHRLRVSLKRHGLIQNLVARSLGDRYEVLSGNQRLRVLTELGYTEVPCVVVTLDDANARLLAQALNRIQGDDDLGLKAEILKEILANIPQADVLALLPETSQSLQAFADLGQQDMAGYLRHWQQAQSARLKHLTFQSTPSQLEIIEQALSRVMPQVKADSGNPNPRGNALHSICQRYLDFTQEIP